jgi:hypothetical protein
MRNAFVFVVLCAVAAAGAAWFSGALTEPEISTPPASLADGEGNDAAVESCDSCTARHQRLDRDRTADE